MAGSNPTPEVRAIWVFWIACALAAVGAIAPLVFSGTSSRIDGAVIPFGVAAVALGACALLYEQGRPLATLLYFIAGLAIVFGILTMLALPVQLAVLGTCPSPPADCGAGVERPITSGENTGMGTTATLGVIAVLTGFFGLVTLYRRLSTTTNAATPSTPPARRIAPVAKPAPAEASQDPAPAPVAEPEPEPAHAAAVPEEELELPAHAEELELPAHAEELELPAHVEPLELAAPEATVETPAAIEAPRKPRRPRAPKPIPPLEPPPDST